MPSLLDAEQQGFASEDAPDIAAALGGAGGGASAVPKDVPQSDSAVIAERLLGPELADRYGDVLGIRKGRAGDFWRDFGNEYAGKGQAEAIKQRVLDQYNQKYRREQQDAQAKDEENRGKIRAYAELIRSVKDVPKKHRVAFLKEGLDKLGMAASPAMQKMLADPEEFNAEEILTPEMVEMLEEDSGAGLQQLEQVGMDPQAAIALKKGIRQMKRDREETGRLILKDEKTRAGIEQMKARTDLIRARTEQVKKGKAGKGGESKTPLLDKLRAGAAAGPAGPRQSVTPTAPNVTVRKVEPAGIAQE